MLVGMGVWSYPVSVKVQLGKQVIRINALGMGLGEVGPAFEVLGRHGKLREILR
jgi:hypothetical protein